MCLISINSINTSWLSLGISSQSLCFNSNTGTDGIIIWYFVTYAVYALFGPKARKQSSCSAFIGHHVYFALTMVKIEGLRRRARVRRYPSSGDGNHNAFEFCLLCNVTRWLRCWDFALKECVEGSIVEIVMKYYVYC